MNAKKQPSGNWRVQVYSHMEDGKKKYISITAPTKAEAMRKATEFAEGKRRALTPQNLTVRECMQRYISAKEAVLSPSTIRSYYQMLNGARFVDIENIQIGRLSSPVLQFWVSNLSAELSPKTVRNMYGLLVSSVHMFSDHSFKVSLPQKAPIERNIPVDSEVRLLLERANPELRLCIALASVGTLRRGEICGLKYKDVLRDFSAVYVHTDVVRDKSGAWVHKECPKTSKSVRRVILPADIMRMIGEGDPEAYIYPHKPNYLTKSFEILRDSLGLRCRFHDLRHYAASILHAIGVPDVYIMERGGWSTDGVLKDVYRNSLADKASHFTSLANAYFEKNITQNITHENAKPRIEPLASGQ